VSFELILLALGLAVAALVLAIPLIVATVDLRDTRASPSTRFGLSFDDTNGKTPVWASFIGAIAKSPFTLWTKGDHDDVKDYTVTPGAAYARKKRTAGRGDGTNYTGWQARCYEYAAVTAGFVGHFAVAFSVHAIAAIVGFVAFVIYAAFMSVKTLTGAIISAMIDLVHLIASKLGLDHLLRRLSTDSEPFALGCARDATFSQALTLSIRHGSISRVPKKRMVSTIPLTSLARRLLNPDDDHVAKRLTPQMVLTSSA
jgi:hypothetical protein